MKQKVWSSLIRVLSPKKEKAFLGLEHFSHKNYMENDDSVADFTSQITHMLQLML